jgi:hypothetical protein
MRFVDRVAAIALVCASIMTGAAPASAATSSPSTSAPSVTTATAHGTTFAGPAPVLAYYYIWYDPTSWRRAKSDLPLLGRYSSDERRVMETHVRWAQQSGIDGFLVSWKHTIKLDRRLIALADVAEQRNFGLAVMYQGLDFARDPLRAEQVEGDLAWFRDNLASRPAFRRWGAPLVVISGTWKFSTAEIARVTGPLRPSLTVLASERNVDGYQRLRKIVDGNALYWSSVNPDTYSNATY